LASFGFLELQNTGTEEEVVVKGTLFQQMTGHHKTEVLINVESLKLATK